MNRDSLKRRLRPVIYSSLYAVAIMMLLSLAGCSTSEHAHEGATDHKHFQYEGSGPVKVTTTIAMITDIVQNVGGSDVEVSGLMGPGVDPHLYKASLSDVVKLSESDIIFYNGLHLEGRMGLVLEKFGERKAVVAVCENIDPKLLRRPAEFEGNPDPHVWFDVSLWMKATEAVRDELAQFDPANRTGYEKRGAEYLAKLRALHAYAKTQLATIPRKRRVLITAHDAFGYFGRAYDVEVVGLQGISTASEYGLNDVQRLVNLIAQRGVKAVFVESSVPRRSVEAVVQGCRAKGHNVKIGGELFSDAMGPPGTPEGTYIGMVRHNVDIIVRSLR